MQMYEQTLKESTTRRLIEISEVDAGVADYEARLKIDLQETRQLYEQQMEENRKEMEELFRQQLKDMNLDSIRDADVANIRLEELHQMRTRMESANKIIADLEAQNASLSARMRDLEQTLEMERIAHAEDKTVLIREIDSLRSKLAENMREFQELLNVKVSLDAEISTYRSLLKNEEHRLNISPGGSSSGSAIRSSQFQQQTPIRRGTPQRGAKRKRTTLEESASLSESNYRVSSKATGDIEIIEVCSEGKFVKLHNKGNKEIVLSGWQIHRVAGEEETIFKFHRSVKMEPDVTITVWSSDAGQTHEPPTNIVMKSQRWFVADNMTTTLINSSAELAVDDSKSECPGVKKLLQKAKNIVGHYRRSSQARERLHSLQERMQVPQLELIQYVETRWSSEYCMLQRLVEMKGPIAAELAQSEHNIEPLTNADWAQAKGVLEVLEPLAQATKEISGDSYPTSSMVIPILHCLSSHLNSRIQRQEEANLSTALRNELYRDFEEMDSTADEPEPSTSNSGLWSFFDSLPNERKEMNISEEVEKYLSEPREVARSERERQQLSSMSSHLRETSGGFASTSRFEGEDIFHQKGDPPAGKDETCRLM
uniref:Lamin n=1 Tax=Timema genevievae TaxID=629358 RepID=A0A7R9JTX5_TIMGE|nr:unnamed protein product [Timema genevievae]